MQKYNKSLLPKLALYITVGKLTRDYQLKLLPRQRESIFLATAKTHICKSTVRTFEYFDSLLHSSHDAHSLPRHRLLHRCRDGGRNPRLPPLTSSSPSSSELFLIFWKFSTLFRWNPIFWTLPRNWEATDRRRSLDILIGRSASLHWCDWFWAT